VTARYIVGDVFDALAKLPDASVDLVMTSPPFLALRSYLPKDHPDKAKEIGSEPTPGEYLDTLLDVIEALERVLAPHGSIVVELGDTYSGSGGAGGDYTPADPSNGTWAMRAGQPTFDGSATKARAARAKPMNTAYNQPGAGERTGPGRTRSDRDGWPLDKSKVLVPELFAVALSYGFNALTGRQTDRWRVRNVVAWCRPNPPVGALSDKFRPATSYLTIACKSRTRYFDMDAVRTEAVDQRFRTTNGPKHGDPVEVQTANYQTRVPSHPAGAPPLDYWVIPTEPYKGSHYAAFPSDLCVTPIEAMCPRRVCTVCGEPSRRLVEHVNSTGNGHRTLGDPQRHARAGSSTDAPDFSERLTLGWSDCGHDSWRNGVVLDPFAGSGTTLAVATGHGRDAIGIDLDERNAELGRQRVGMWLVEIEYPEVAHA